MLDGPGIRKAPKGQAERPIGLDRSTTCGMAMQVPGGDLLANLPREVLNGRIERGIGEILRVLF